jgi:hypothetical protein
MTPQEPDHPVSQTALTLAEACIHAARYSNKLLTQAWIDGSLTTFGYFDAQYLFSSAIILAISSLSIGNDNDRDSFESAAQVLQCMSADGNLSAGEFCEHLEEVQSSINAYRQRSMANSSTAMPPFGTLVTTTVMENASAEANTGFRNVTDGLTTEMAFLEPPMQDFLAQADVDPAFFDPVESMNHTTSLYTWATQPLQDEN